MKKLLLALALFSTPAFAGGSTGNGGQSVICHGRGPGFTTAEAFDTFESAYLFGYPYASSTVTKDGLALALRIAAELDASVPSNMRFVERVKYIADKIDVAPSSGELPLTSDIRAFFMPVMCRLIQTIVFESDNEIKVNRSAWDVLPEHSRAALFLHEAIYWHLRDASKETDSRRTRRIVSFLLNGGDIRTAPAAMSTFDPTPAFCTTYGGIRKGNSNGLYLALDPTGAISLFMPAGPNSGMMRAKMSGNIPGAALFSGSSFRPSGNGSFDGSLADARKLDVRIVLKDEQVFLSLTGVQGFSKEAKLGCRPFGALLPQ